MVEHVQNNGLFTQELLDEFSEICNHRKTGLIKISVFEDGSNYLHDGHHRCLSIYLGGRKFLHDSEYVCENWTYEAYQEINFDDNWVTPFDVRTQVRLADFKAYKEKAMRLRDKDFVLSNTNCFCKPRNVYSIADLAETYFANGRNT